MRTRFLSLLGLAALMVLLAQAGRVLAAADRQYDFEFKGMDIKKVVSSLAKLQNKSVIFSRGVEPRLVELSLANVSIPFAMSLVLQNYGLIATLENNVYHIMLPAERGVQANPSVVITLSHVLARDIMENVRSFMGNTGGISVNDSINALIVNAKEDSIPGLRTLIAELDRAPPQVFIEAKIVQASTTFSRQLGLQWGKNLSDRTQPGVNFSASTGANQLVFNVANIAQLQAQLTAGESRGEVKIISSPKISTLNGMTAAIESDQTFNIRTLAAVTGASSGSSSGTQVAGGLTQIKTGVSLRVTPNIMSDDQVRLTISLVKSDPDLSNVIDGIPGSTDNTANTSLVVRSGQTASIGGLIQRSDSHSVDGVPFLSKLPLIGALFGNYQTAKQDSEIMIFLTPTVFRADDVEEPDDEEEEAPKSINFGKKPLKQPEEFKVVVAPDKKNAEKKSGKKATEADEDVAAVSDKPEESAPAKTVTVPRPPPRAFEASPAAFGNSFKTVVPSNNQPALMPNFGPSTDPANKTSPSADPSLLLEPIKQ